jgi:hypothetical protein
MLISCHKSPWQSHNTKILWWCAKFRHLGTPVGNEKLIHEEVRRFKNLANACYQSGYNFLLSHLLSETKELEWNRYHFASSFVLARNFVPYVKRRRQRALKTIFGSKRNKILWVKITSYNENFHKLCYSAINRIITSRRIGWVGNVGRM